MSSIADEQVLVVPTLLFHELGHFQGFSPDAERYARVLLAAENISFRPRGEVETDPSWKQLIPYILLCYTPRENMPRENDSQSDANFFAESTQIFCYVRGKGMGEGRLHRKKSVGIGGHISACDFSSAAVANLYREGMQRELSEEVDLQTAYTESCIGMINDDETEVGRVHLGIVHRFDLEFPNVTPRESDILECGFVSPHTLLREADQLETWSALTLRALVR